MIGYSPPVVAAGLPDSVPLAAVKVTPVGKVPVSARLGLGVPEAATTKVPVVPAVKVVDVAEVKRGVVVFDSTMVVAYAVVGVEAEVPTWLVAWAANP